jgi:hypothetical protein
MAAKKKRVDPIKQREKRAKIVAIAGAVLLVGVAAFEVPSVLSMMNQKPPPGANATDAGNRNPDGSIPLPNVATPTATTANGELADSDVPPTNASNGQLVSFDMFQTKNPFTPQVKTTAATSSQSGTADPYGPPTTTPTSTTPAPTATTPTSTTPSSAVPPAGGATTPTTPTNTTPASTTPTSTTPTSTTPTSTTPVSQTVAISVNGVVSHVAVDDTFPSASPVFRLVSFAKGTAQIGIVGGSYESGDQTLTLHQGQAVTLENQTSGTRYKIELIATP